jgi:hypothetical protein
MVASRFTGILALSGFASFGHDADARAKNRRDDIVVR